MLGIGSVAPLAASFIENTVCVCVLRVQHMVVPFWCRDQDSVTGEMMTKIL